MATLKDVAKKAGVAVSTASWALNDSDKVSEKTKQKVWRVAKELNYQKNGLARDLKLNKTQTIGLILPDLSGPYFSQLIKGVQEAAKSTGYGLIACSSLTEDDVTAPKFLQERRVDGVIVLAHTIQDELLCHAARNDFPIVVLDRELTDEHVISVTVDNVSGAYDMTTLLLKEGHRNICFVGGPVNSRDAQMRFSGYKKALREWGISWTGKGYIEGKFTKEGGELAARLLLMQEDLPTAVFCANDEMAVGMLHVFQSAGIAVPDDISIVGFDDIELAQYVQPPLTTVRQPKYDAGSLAVRLISQSLSGDFPSKKQYLLPTEIIIRQSTAANKQA